MNNNDASILAVAGLSPEAAGWSKTLDYMVIVIAALVVMAVTYINFLLLAGDWDFFIDWKDRQFWVLIQPIVTIMVIAAFQAIFWNIFRLPIGATASALLFIIGAWVVRYHSWYGLAHFPISLVIPGTFLIGAMILDAILTLTGTWLLTALFGGALYGFLYYPTNWIIFAPFHQPVELMGQMSSLADVIGYTFPRAGMPEYGRIIERGSTNTFGAEPVWLSAVFASFISIFMYMAWWGIGAAMAKMVSFIPTGRRFKSLYTGRPRETEVAA